VDEVVMSVIKSFRLDQETERRVLCHHCIKDKKTNALKSPAQVRRQNGREVFYCPNHGDIQDPFIGSDFFLLLCLSGVDSDD
jgi:hypothetical protein